MARFRRLCLTPEGDLRQAGFLFLLGLLLLLAYPQVFLGSETFFFRDYSQLAYQTALYHQDAMRQGELALWNPYSNTGIPFLAQWGMLVLYPLALFYLALPLSWALGVLALGQLYLGGVGVFQLARHWGADGWAAAAAGVVFVFNGLAVNTLMWPGMCGTLGWMPWVILTVEGALTQPAPRRRVWAVATGSLQMLTGVPEVILFTWLLIGALALRIGLRRESSWLRLAGQLGILVAGISLVCAAQLLPFLQLLGLSQRGAGYAGDEWSIPGWGWANYLVPLFHSFPWSHGVWFQHGQFLTPTYYIGTGTVAWLLLAGRRTAQGRGLALLPVLFAGLILATGDSGRVYAWLREVFPVLGFMRFPVKFLYLVNFIAPLLAAVALTHQRRATDRPAWRLPVAFGLPLVLTLLVLVFAWAFPLYGTQPDFRGPIMANGFWRLAALIGCAFLTRAYLKAPVPRRPATMGLLLVLLLWVDLRFHAPDPNPTVDRGVYGQNQLDLEPRPSLGRGRVMTRPSAQLALHRFQSTNAVTETAFKHFGLYSNWNLSERLPSVGGVYSLALARTDDIDKLLSRIDANHEGWLDFLGVSQISSRENPLDWKARPSALPWVTAGQGTVRSAGTNTLEFLKDPDWDPRRTVYLETGDPDSGAMSPVPATIRNLDFASHRVAFEVEAPGPTVAVIAQSWYPAWKAEVNGEAAPVWIANHAYQSVPVPAGRSQVVLTYRSGSFRLGCLLSALGLIALAWEWHRGRPRVGHPASE